MNLNLISIYFIKRTVYNSTYVYSKKVMLRELYETRSHSRQPSAHDTVFIGRKISSWGSPTWGRSSEAWGSQSRWVFRSWGSPTWGRSWEAWGSQSRSVFWLLSMWWLRPPSRLLRQSLSQEHLDGRQDFKRAGRIWRWDRLWEERRIFEGWVNFRGAAGF